MRSPGKKRGIDATGVGDQGSAEGAEMLVQCGALGGEVRSRFHKAILRWF